MARTANRFTASDGTTYDWHVNHDEEENFGKRRNIEHTANVSGWGLIRQQGDDSPVVIRLSGKILHRAQITQFDYWMARCRYESIHFRDFAGEEYEVIITAFEPKRVRTLFNPRDQTNAPLWYWTYTMEMEVLRVVSGSRIWMNA